MLYKTTVYENDNGNIPLEKFFKDLANNHKKKELAQVKLFVNHLEEFGFEVNKYFPNTIKQLRGDIWELRPGGNRILFFHYEEGVFILLFGFEKKTQKTPPEYIDKAISYRNDYLRRKQV